MSRRLVALLSVVFLLATSYLVLAADKRAADKGIASAEWPQWRGPRRDNVSTDKGLLDSWPSDGPPLVWKASNLGTGFSTVSVSGGRIFTMGDRANAQTVIALDMKGKELWATPVGKPWPGGYSGPRCSPTVDGDLLYVVDTDGDIVCLASATGKEVWRKSFPKDFAGKMHSGWGFSESPLVDRDRVICTPGGPDAGIVALNKKTGAEIWRCAIPKIGDKGGDGAAYSSIVISNGGGVRQYVQLMGRGVVGVSDDGRFLWGYNNIANGTANIPTPLVSGDYVFCSTGYGDGGAALVKLVGSGKEVQAEEVYFLKPKEMQNHHGGMVMIGDYVYCGHGHKLGAPTCLNWRTGKIVWRKDRGPGADSAAVCYADGNMYFRYQDGLIALIGAAPDEYKLKGTFRIPECNAPSWPHPVVVGGMLYLREQDNLFCYDVRK